MPEVFDKDATQAAVGEQALIGYGLASAANRTFDIPVQPDPAQESFLHPVKAVNDLLNGLGRIEALLSLLVKDNQRQRTPIDRSKMIGATLFYNIDYLDRKYLYLLSSTACQLNLSSGGTVDIPANVWTDISFPRGTMLTQVGGTDVAPLAVTIRACDVPIENPSESNNQATKAVLSSVPGNAAAVILSAANQDRKGWSVYNDSSATLYLGDTDVNNSGTVSTTIYTVQVPPGGYWEHPLPIYPGIIEGIWSASAGNARITEWS